VKMAWKETWNVTIVKDNGEYCLRGTVGLGKAPWFHQIVKPKMISPSSLPKERLTMMNAPIGKDIPSTCTQMSFERAKEYSTNIAKDSNPIWNSVIHPGWIAARMTILIEHSMNHLPAIHTHSKIQNLKRPNISQTITTAGHFVTVYERNGHHYAVVDGLISSEDGEPLAMIQHHTIFKIRPAL